MKLIDLLVKELPRRGGWPEAANYVVQDYDGTVKFSKSIDFLHIKAGEWCSNEDGDDWIYGDRPFEGNFIHHTIAHDRNSSIITRAQYEAALAASDGWIEWHGGDCPVDSDAIVEVKYRKPNQYQFNNDLAGDFTWSHDGIDGDIIAYRLQQPGIDSRANDDRLEQDLNECIGASDAQAWYGVGLPPVGVKCEFTHGPYSIEAGELTGITPKVGEVVEVVAHRLTSDNNPVAVVYWDDNGAGRFACFVEECFRQIRTEAEMAREKLAASLHIAADASPIELNGIGALYFKLADAIISGSVFGTTFREGK